MTNRDHLEMAIMHLDKIDTSILIAELRITKFKGYDRLLDRVKDFLSELEEDEE